MHVYSKQRDENKHKKNVYKFTIKFSYRKEMNLKKMEKEKNPYKKKKVKNKNNKIPEWNDINNSYKKTGNLRINDS